MREITREDLKNLEDYADKLFKAVGIDVSFTKHFLDRVNDPRNKKQITVQELIRLFREEYAKWGKKIAQLGPDAEAVLKDMKTNINVPFVLKWNKGSKDLDLVSKTIMRKPNFRTPDREFPIHEENIVGSGNIAGLGIGPKGEPGVGKSKVLKRGKFAGHDTFIVSPDVFHKARLHKKKLQHWSTYLGMSEDTDEIREYANKNPYKAIVLQDELTGSMVFCRYGKRKQ